MPPFIIPNQFSLSIAHNSLYAPTPCAKHVTLCNTTQSFVLYTFSVCNTHITQEQNTTMLKIYQGGFECDLIVWNFHIRLCGSQFLWLPQLRCLSSAARSAAGMRPNGCTNVRAAAFTFQCFSRKEIRI
jgi:hypothetical protein